MSNELEILAEMKDTEAILRRPLLWRDMISVREDSGGCDLGILELVVCNNSGLRYDGSLLRCDQCAETAIHEFPVYVIQLTVYEHTGALLQETKTKPNKITHVFAIRSFLNLLSKKRWVVLDSTPPLGQCAMHPFIVEDLNGFLYGTYRDENKVFRRHVSRHLLGHYGETDESSIRVYVIAGDDDILLEEDGDSEYDYDLIRRLEAPAWNKNTGSKAVYNLQHLSVYKIHSSETESLSPT